MAILTSKELDIWKRSLAALPDPTARAQLLASLNDPVKISDILKELEPLEQEGILDALPAWLSEAVRKILEEKVEIPSELMEEIIRGECVLFLGAGIAQEAGLPSTQRLIRALGEDPEVVPELSRAAGAYEARYGRQKLIEVIRREFNNARPYVNPQTYYFIVNIPELSWLIVTTNWDTQLEEAFSGEEKHPTVVTKPENLFLIGAPGIEHVIVKLHGDIKNPLDPSFVITDTDYAHISRDWMKPVGFGAWLGDLMTTRTLIFVGYSVTDENFRIIRDLLRAKMRDTQGRFIGKIHYLVAPWKEKEAWMLEKLEYMKVIRAKARQFFGELFSQLTEFINREEEIRFICEEAPSNFVQIYGNAGIGKTKLLQGLKREFKVKKGYSPVFYLDFRRREITKENFLRALAEGAEDFKPASSSLDAFLGDVKNRKAAFLLDSLESIERDMKNALEVRQEIESLLEGLRHLEGERAGEFRVILASRHPINWSPWLNIFSMELTPFRREAVEEMVKRYSALYRRRAFGKEDRATLAGYILDITGTGHAKIIKEILEELFKAKSEEELPSSSDMVSYLERHKTTLAERAVDLLKQEKLNDLDPRVLTALESGLCVVRKFNADVLSLFKGREMGPDALYEEPMQLINLMNAVHILEPPGIKEPLFRVDPVIRFAFSRWLELSDEERFLRAHRTAYEAFSEVLKKSVDQYQAICIIECLWHYSFEDPKPEELAQQLDNVLLQEIESSRPGQEAVIIYQILSGLEEDEELTQRFNALTAKQGVELRNNHRGKVVEVLRQWAQKLAP